MNQQIKKIAFTYYPVKDLPRARAFYEGLLGLKPGESFGETWQEYDMGGTTFAITSMTDELSKVGVQSSIAFEVQNLKKFVKDLQAKNVQFTEKEPMETPVCWVAILKDPDDNTVMLHQLK